MRVDFHGFVIAVDSTSPDLVEVLSGRLRGLSSTAAGESAFVFRYLTVDRPSEVLKRPDGSMRPIYDTPFGQVEYFPQSDSLFLDYGDEARLLVRPAGSEVVIAFRPRVQNLWLASHPLFTLALVELLKRRGVYSVHAAGLARTGQSIILAGSTGAGKSTLTLALLDAGLELLGDDMTFLKMYPDGLRVLAFPDEIDVTPQTLAMFPSRKHTPIGGSKDGWKKLQLSAEVLGDPCVAWESKPVVLVFPSIAGTATSRLVPMTRGEALVQLAPNVLLSDPASSQGHLSALSALASSCQCYRLMTGTDLAAAGSLLDSILRRAGATMSSDFVAPGAR